MEWSSVVVPVMSTVFTAITLFFLRWVWFNIQKMLNEGRADMVNQISGIKMENKSQLDRIEEQVKATNGTVISHTSTLTDLDRRLISDEARTEMLTRLFLKDAAITKEL